MMKITESFIQNAKEYYRIKTIINCSHDNKNNELWQQLCDVEQEILAPFYLFENAMQFQDILSDFAYEENCSVNRIEKLYEEILFETELYFLEDVKTDLQILQEGVALNLSSFEIISKMNKFSNTYPQFLILKLYKKEDYSINKILDAINWSQELSTENTSLLTNFTATIEDKSKIDLSVFEQLNMPYINEYQEYLEEFPKDLIDFQKNYGTQKDKKYIIFHSYEITKLAYHKGIEYEAYGEAKMYFNAYNTMGIKESYFVFVSHVKLIQYLSNAVKLKYFDLLVPMIHIFFDEKKADIFYEIDIIKCYEEAVIIKDILVLKNK